MPTTPTTPKTQNKQVNLERVVKSMELGYRLFKKDTRLSGEFIQKTQTDRTKKSITPPESPTQTPATPSILKKESPQHPEESKTVHFAL